MLKIRTLPLLIVFILTVNLAPTPTYRPSSPAGGPNARVDAQLRSFSGQLGYFVTLRQAADLRVTVRGWAERGAAVYARLTATAADSQTAVIERLIALQRSGHVRTWRSYWIINALYVVGDSNSVGELAKLPAATSLIISQRQHIATTYVTNPPSSPPQPNILEWNISQINAPAVWSLGDRGAGITVGDLSTGGIATHPALSRQYRGASVLPGHAYNWYDAVSNSSSPLDDNGVGTHNLGVMVGEDSTQTNQTGVAPAANWIACKAFAADGYGDDAAILACMQWLLAPTDLSGQNPRPDLRPRIINGGWMINDGADTTYQPAVQAWLAADIVPIFAVGDTFNGQASCNVAAPASYAESFALGASDRRDYIAPFSCLGPSPLGGRKPQAVAPGVTVRSSVPNGSCYLCNNGQYNTYSSSGVAAAHASGLAALLLARNPVLTPNQLTYIITSTAHFSPTWGGQPSNTYGWGRLDALAAYNAVPAPGGAIIGRVTSAATPLAGAVISTTGSPAFVNTATASGYYTLAVAPAAYTLTARRYGYYSQAASVNVSNGVTLTQNFDLSPAPSYSLTLNFASPDGPISGTLSLDDAPYTDVAVTSSLTLSLPAGAYLARFTPADPCLGFVTANVTAPSGAVNILSPYRQDEFGYTCRRITYSWLGGTNLISFSNRDEGAASVNLPFPFTLYGVSYGSMSIGTNGNIQFVAPSTSGTNDPIPNPAAPNAALYPFWDDLTLVNQGNVYTGIYGVAPNRRFVVEWRAVQHYDNAQPYGNYTFAAILNEGSSYITYQYATMSGDDANGDSATLGIENAAGSIAFAYGYNQPLLGSNMAVQYRVPGYVPPSPTPFGPSPTPCPNPFADIGGNTFYAAINFLYCRGVVNGTSPNTFSPANTSTRAQFAKVVVLGFGIPSYTPSSGQSFNDVAPSYFAFGYIEAGYQAAILSGFDANTCQAAGTIYPCYLPNRAITRGQITKLVVGAAGYTPYTPTSPTFVDVPPNNIFYLSIETAHYHAVINGYSDNTFRPNNNVRRDEMSQIVYKGMTSP